MWLTPGYRRFALPAFVGTAVAAVVFPPPGVVLPAVGAFALWFFRDPERSPPDEPGVVAPVDRRISVVCVKDGHVRVDALMNVTDVHVNRTPVSGSVQTVTHRPDTHKPAFSKDFDRNERVGIELDTDTGDHEVSLIAGAFTRRIHSYVTPGSRLVRGQKLGHVGFGSRADALLPPKFGSEDVVVEKGESVRASEAVLARRE